jgi:acyl-coenzyme A synthetase/AMP-(fatty) acid ligase
VGIGDVVVIYLPKLMELPIAMLACARIDAVHSVIVLSVCSSGESVICLHVPVF